MTARRPVPLDPEDLLVRARRGDLGADQRDALERALEASAHLRVAYQVGRDFDDTRRVQAGDDELIKRASSRALARPQRGGRRAVFFAAAALLVVGSAVGASTMLIGSASVRPFEKQVEPPRMPELGPQVSRHGRESPRDVAPLAPLPETATPAVTPPIEHAERQAAPSHSVSLSRTPAGSAPEKSAPSLFREANAARRSGELAAAQALYAELQASFPGTSEARVSHVSLGKLLLGAGKTREAERQFRAYLSTGGGDLSEEALVGRAEALGRLGESGEERRVWQDLQRTHPSSVYAVRAQKRLEELASAERPKGAARN